MNMTLIIIFYFISIPLVYGEVVLENISGDDVKSIAERKKVLLNKENNGIRLAWDGMKEKNKEFKTGTVDISVKEFEDQMIEQFNGEEFKRMNPGVEVKVKKMDFKGYYITCTPLPHCTGSVHDFVKEFPPGKLVEADDKGNIIKSSDFNLTSAEAENFDEGYIKARARAAYPEYKEQLDCKGPKCKEIPLHEFVDKKVKQALVNATGTSDIQKIKATDPDFMKKLSRLIELTRAGEEIPESEKSLKAFKPLVKALDVLLETPFKNSNNLNEELKTAISSAVDKSKKFTVTSAKSGDDLFVIIKDADGTVVKVVGADARGLGVTNMTARYDEVLNQYQNKNGINSIDDILSLSGAATGKVDIKMGESLDNYIKTIKEAVEQPDTSLVNLSDKLESASISYHEETMRNPNLMQMRTAAVPDCSPKNQCILDSITLIHNLLKKMEAEGYNGHFGDSCIGVMYWMRKKNISI